MISLKRFIILFLIFNGDSAFSQVTSDVASQTMSKTGYTFTSVASGLWNWGQAGTLNINTPTYVANADIDNKIDGFVNDQIFKASEAGIKYVANNAAEGSWISNSSATVASWEAAAIEIAPAVARVGPATSIAMGEIQLIDPAEKNEFAVMQRNGTSLAAQVDPNTSSSYQLSADVTKTMGFNGGIKPAEYKETTIPAMLDANGNVSAYAPVIYKDINTTANKFSEDGKIPIPDGAPTDPDHPKYTNYSTPYSTITVDNTTHDAVERDVNGGVMTSISTGGLAPPPPGYESVRSPQAIYAYTYKDSSGNVLDQGYSSYNLGLVHNCVAADNGGVSCQSKTNPDGPPVLLTQDQVGDTFKPVVAATDTSALPTHVETVEVGGQDHGDYSIPPEGVSLTATIPPEELTPLPVMARNDFPSNTGTSANDTQVNSASEIGDSPSPIQATLQKNLNEIAAIQAGIADKTPPMSGADGNPITGPEPASVAQASPLTTDPQAMNVPSGFTCSMLTSDVARKACEQESGECLSRDSANATGRSDAKNYDCAAHVAAVYGGSQLADISKTAQALAVTSTGLDANASLLKSGSNTTQQMVGQAVTTVATAGAGAMQTQADTDQNLATADGAIATIAANAATKGDLATAADPKKGYTLTAAPPVAGSTEKWFTIAGNTSFASTFIKGATQGLAVPESKVDSAIAQAVQKAQTAQGELFQGAVGAVVAGAQLAQDANVNTQGVASANQVNQTVASEAPPPATDPGSSDQTGE